MLATICRNPIHHRIDLLREASWYNIAPPNVNGQFTQLHHNFNPSTYLGLVYGIPPHDEETYPGDLYGAFNDGAQHPWRHMHNQDIVNNIDASFLDCFTTEQRVSLWDRFLPWLATYMHLFCSICCCRLPEFYFTKSQRRRKRTERACVHCDRNRQLKISQVTQTLGAGRIFCRAS
jgi:hypothetical protein